MNKLYQLNIKELFHYTTKQKPTFWIILLYLIFEYLRPQTMYPAVNIIPWGMVIIFFALLLLVFEGKLFSVKNRSNKYINLFSLIVIISSLFAISPSTSYNELKLFFVLLIIYYLIINIVDTEGKLLVFMLLYFLINLKLSNFTTLQWIQRGFAYDRFGATAGLAWLENSGEFAIEMCIVLAISIFFTIALWKHISFIKKAFLIWIPASAASSILACGSRGGFLGIAFVLFFVWLESKQKIIAVIIVLLIAAPIPFLISERDKTRFVNMGDKLDKTAQKRLMRWKKGIAMANKYPVLGVGYKNWAQGDLDLYGFMGAEVQTGTGAVCHNIFIECMSELGYSGLILFILLIISTFKNNLETIQIAKENKNDFICNLAKGFNGALVAYLVTGFFVTVLYYPFFWINLAMTVSTNNIATKKYINKS